MEQTTALAKLDPQMEAAVEVAVNRALVKQQASLMSVAAFDSALQLAEKIAASGILGTMDKNVVLKLYLLSRDEGVPVTQVQNRWHVWVDTKGKVTTQRRTESMLADYRLAGGKFRLVENTPRQTVGAFLAPGMEKPLIVVADGETVDRAGLGGRPIHQTYPGDMRVWYVIRRGIRWTMPECLTGDPLPFDGDGAPMDIGDFEVDAADIPSPDRPTPGTPLERGPQAASAVDVVSAMRKAASDNKKLWHPEGKPTKDDYAPAWAWLSIRVGAPVTGPGDVTADTLDLAREVLALGKEEVLSRLADHKAQADADVVDAEVDGDDPFDNVS